MRRKPIRNVALGPMAVFKQYRTIIFVFIGIKKFRAYVETRRAKRYYRSVLKFPLKLRMI